jgi:hypothetical protein
VRDVGDVRDVRDVRDVGDVRDMRDVRDVESHSSFFGYLLLVGQCRNCRMFIRLGINRPDRWLNDPVPISGLHTPGR